MRTISHPHLGENESFFEPLIHPFYIKIIQCTTTKESKDRRLFQAATFKRNQLLTRTLRTQRLRESSNRGKRTTVQLNNGAEKCTGHQSSYEHSEQARAPHTNGPRDVPRSPVWGSEFTSKDAALQGGMMVVLMPLFAATLSLCVAGTSSLRPGRFPRRRSLCIAGE